MLASTGESEEARRRDRQYEKVESMEKCHRWTRNGKKDKQDSSKMDTNA
jgi:hypothetical protein